MTRAKRGAVAVNARQPVRLLVHDLVQVSLDAFASCNDAPAWVEDSLRVAPWVVCRRACGERSLLPIGVRGAHRSQRYGARISRHHVLETLRPEDLVARARRYEGRLGEAARNVARVAGGYGLRWGPTGSFGFQLAADVPATHAISDLDIVIRAAGVSQSLLRRFGDACDAVAHATGVRIDAELAFGAVGVALAEYCNARDRVPAKTPNGPAWLVISR